LFSLVFVIWPGSAVFQLIDALRNELPREDRKVPG